MEWIKNIIKRLIYARKFRGRKVRIAKSCRLAGTSCVCEGMNVLNDRVSFSGKIGYGSYIGADSSINALIGRYCCIADKVQTVSGTHPASRFVSVHPCFF